jgi:uridine phosphorylase
MAFPKFQNKHRYAPFFSPEDYIAHRTKTSGPLIGKPLDGLILCYSRKFLKYVTENHKTTRIGDVDREIYLINDTKDKIAIGIQGMGAPAAVSFFEELIASGVKRFVSVGYAGALQKNLKINDIIVCDRAIRDEGTSHHYIKHSKYSYASKDMTGRIRSVLEKNKVVYDIGSSWTIDALYRETVKEIKQYQKEGVLTVDMEASALFAVAKYRKVELGSLFVISDSLAEPNWSPKFHLMKDNYELLLKVAVESLMHPGGND